MEWVRRAAAVSIRGRFFILTANSFAMLAASHLDRLSRLSYPLFVGKELAPGEDGNLDRILRRLKLHAEGRQFGDQNS